MSSNSRYSMRRRRFWTGVIERWQLSDFSAREFCKQEGVAESSFYSWRKDLTCGKTVQEAQSAGFLEVTVPAVESASLEVELPCGSIIRISHSAQIGLLTRVLIALREENLC